VFTFPGYLHSLAHRSQFPLRRREVELCGLASFDVSQAVPAPTHLFQRYERFASILIRPQSFAPLVESNCYFSRHGLCQEGSAVKRSYDVSHVIALTADRTYRSHGAFLAQSVYFQPLTARAPVSRSTVLERLFDLSSTTAKLRRLFT
jgi:hypothetical protein